MKLKVGVEPNLTPVKDYLSEKGWQVESVNLKDKSLGQLDNFDAFVVTGLNDNALGLNDTSTNAVIIEATGLTAEQVYSELQARFE
ncbi:MAG: YkuS family protein [Clostridia bacterium]|nr:YkuS family protein [Clostridia bacterium]